jgi:tagaturonate reductase
MATGFAGFLLYMKAIKKEGNRYFGERNGTPYEIKDDSAEYFYNIWKNNTPDKLAEEVLQNEELWDTDLSNLPGFLQLVQEQLQEMIDTGVLQTIELLETKKATV